MTKIVPAPASLVQEVEDYVTYLLRREGLAARLLPTALRSHAWPRRRRKQVRDLRR